MSNLDVCTPEELAELRAGIERERQLLLRALRDELTPTQERALVQLAKLSRGQRFARNWADYDGEKTRTALMRRGLVESVRSRDRTGHRLTGMGETVEAGLRARGVAA